MFLTLVIFINVPRDPGSQFCARLCTVMMDMFNSQGHSGLFGQQHREHLPLLVQPFDCPSVLRATCQVKRMVENE